MVNAHFKCRHISQFKRLIDVINYWKWKDKEWIKVREEMLDQTGTPFISGVVDIELMFGLLFWKVKIYAYNFHEDWKTQICRIQIQSLATKEKSKSVLQSNQNITRKFTHSWSSKRQNDVKFGGWKDKTIYNFHADHLLKFWC